MIKENVKLVNELKAERDEKKILEEDLADATNERNQQFIDILMLKATINDLKQALKAKDEQKNANDSAKEQLYSQIEYLSTQKTGSVLPTKIVGNVTERRWSVEERPRIET
ncbi:MAG: hypothetical protein EZS28_049738, partial [Streblomastix strix]